MKQISANSYKIFKCICFFNFVICFLLLTLCYCRNHFDIKKSHKHKNVSTIKSFHQSLRLSDNIRLFRKSTFKKSTKIFCFVLTQPDNFRSKAMVAYDSWAKECDKVKFISVIPKSLKASSESNELMFEDKLPLLQPTGHVVENYNNLTDKVFKTIAELYKKYSSDYDWFLKADDDTFVFVENLRTFLIDKNPDKLSYYGQNLKEWIAGGAGYVLSQATVKKLGHILTTRPKIFFYTGTVNKLKIILNFTYL
jgi:hypothetical protein